MKLTELYRAINDICIKNNLPTFSEENFLVEICVMQLTGKIMIMNGEVFTTYKL